MQSKFCRQQKALETMNDRVPDTPGRLPMEIRRQFGSPAMMRFVRSLPSFGEPPGTDDRFAALLDELDRAESGRNGARSANMTGN